jgi:hypothetical protein
MKKKVETINMTVSQKLLMSVFQVVDHSNSLIAPSLPPALHTHHLDKAHLGGDQCHWPAAHVCDSTIKLHWHGRLGCRRKSVSVRGARVRWGVLSAEAWKSGAWWSERVMLEGWAYREQFG